MEFDGVALAAIQGLNQKLEERVKAKDAELEAQREQISGPHQRLDALEKLVSTLMDNQ